MERDELAKAFNEWLRRWQVDPSGFIELQKATASYGDAAADYLLQLIAEQKAQG